MAGDAVEGSQDRGGILKAAGGIGLQKIAQEGGPLAGEIAGGVGGERAQRTGRIARERFVENRPEGVPVEGRGTTA